MLDVTSAITAARNYLHSVFSSEVYANVRLEEVVLSDDDRFWLVTLSFDRPELGGTLWKKEYRIVKIDANSSQARGVQIRELV